MWTVGFFSDAAIAEVKALPRDLQASFERIVTMIEAHGLERMREPYVKHAEGKLWEMRLSGRNGIALALRDGFGPPRGGAAHFRQEVAEGAAQGDRTGSGKGEGRKMSKNRKFTPARELFAEWHNDPEYVREYDALEAEFALGENGNPTLETLLKVLSALGIKLKCGADLAHVA